MVQIIQFGEKKVGKGVKMFPKSHFMILKVKILIFRKKVDFCHFCRFLGFLAPRPLRISKFVFGPEILPYITNKHICKVTDHDGVWDKNYGQKGVQTVNNQFLDIMH